MTRRAAAHAALGDERRLAIVDALADSDLTFAALGQLVNIPGNLLSHHLSTLESAGLIERRTSEGDRRRKYVTLRAPGLDLLQVPRRSSVGQVSSVAFICSANSARSQFAAAQWRALTGMDAASAGSHPAATVHPKAVAAAAEMGIDLSGAIPGGLDRVPANTDIVISVCDRAHETSLPGGSRRLHWSVPDPVPIGKISAFRASFSEIAARIERFSSRVPE